MAVRAVGVVGTHESRLILHIHIPPSQTQLQRGPHGCRGPCWCHVCTQAVQRCTHISGVSALPLPHLCPVQFSSFAQSFLTLCDPMNRSTPGLPVHHQLLEFTQTHVHRVGDAIQPSHPLSSPSPLAPNPSQHQSLFQ